MFRIIILMSFLITVVIFLGSQLFMFIYNKFGEMLVIMSNLYATKPTLLIVVILFSVALTLFAMNKAFTFKMHASCTGRS
ncbi:hypothetical protein N478_03555 [Pseudoalteromonas luteoviolacea S4060-1]|uniref:Uncharacterized protein n=1 Tax=Pseudoalteromonas luteoviolacea S4060-1 TaxID=1365257 RepID=A0A161YNG8_9GAMM|nr:hypothetical protein N478_03555 [Pseudoalteromonas luteoviolacea S4060-1]